MRWSVQDDRETDEALAERAQKGDAAATEQLLLRYKNTVRARARTFFLQGWETDDLVQEGMIGLYLAIGSYNPAAGKSFKNFAYLCVTRRIYDVLRASKGVASEEFDPETADGGFSPEDALLDLESRAELSRTLMRALSDFEFRVVTMYLDGMSYAEISSATGKQVKSVDNALSRAKRKLCGYLR